MSPMPLALLLTLSKQRACVPLMALLLSVVVGGGSVELVAHDVHATLRQQRQAAAGRCEYLVCASCPRGRNRRGIRQK